MSAGYLLIIFHTLLFARSSSAAEYYSHHKELSQVELEQRVRSYDLDAIIESGYRGTSTVMPLLEEIAHSTAPSEAYIGQFHEPRRMLASRRAFEAHRFAKIRRTAKAALAKLGNKEYLDEFIVLLSTSDKYVKYESIQVLGYIGDTRAISHLGPLLYDTTSPPPLGHLDFDSYAMATAAALDHILPSVSAELQKSAGKKRVFQKEWVVWWESNKGSYK